MSSKTFIKVTSWKFLSPVLRVRRSRWNHIAEHPLPRQKHRPYSLHHPGRLVDGRKNYLRSIATQAPWQEKVRIHIATTLHVHATDVLTAKSRTIAVRLISMAMTGYYKTFVRPRQHRPLSMLKYDPVGESETDDVMLETRTG